MLYIVSQYYSPVQNAPANRLNILVKTLSSASSKFNFEIVTGMPNYPYGKLMPKYKGKLYLHEIGQYDETIHHLFEIPAENKGFFKKTIGYISFSISVFNFFLFKRISKDDIIFVSSPPVFQVYSLYFLSFIKKFRLVLDIRDIWPESIVPLGFLKEKSFFYRFFLALSIRVYKRSEYMIGVTPGIVKYVEGICPGSKVHFISNQVDVSLFHPLSPGEITEFKNENPDVFKKKYTVLFSGTIAAYVDLLTMMKAINIVKEKYRDFSFIVIGHGEEKEKLENYCRKNKLDELVKFLPYMDRSKLNKYISAADFCYYTLMDAEAFNVAIPTKTLEYLACNKFLIASAEGEYPEELEQHKIAVTAPPGNSKKLAEVLIKVFNDEILWANKSLPREYVSNNFSSEKFQKEVLGFFDRIT